jgi:TPR repeat protein
MLFKYEDTYGFISYSLGNSYRKLGTYEGNKNAIYYFNLSGDFYNMNAYASLGDLYWYGIGCQIDKEKAFKYYMKSVKKISKYEKKHILHTSSLYGNFRMGCIYKDNTKFTDYLSDEERKKKTFEFFSNSLYQCKCHSEKCDKSCIQLDDYHIPSTVELAFCYINAYGINKDMIKFNEYLTIAINKGYVPAIIYAGDLYYNGSEDFPQNTEKAIELYISASKYNNNSVSFSKIIKAIENTPGYTLTHFPLLVESYLNYFIKEPNVIVKQLSLTQFISNIQKDEHQICQKQLSNHSYLRDNILSYCHQKNEFAYFIVNNLMKNQFWSYKYRVFSSPRFNQKLNLVMLCSKKYHRKNQIYLPMEMYLTIFEFLPSENW